MARKKPGPNPEIRVRAGFRAEFPIRARFRVQNLIFVRVERTWVLKTRVENFRAGSPGPLSTPAHTSP